MTEYTLPIQVSAGLAESKYRGIKGSLYRSVGTDIHSIPGLLQVNQKLTKDSGTTVTDFIKYAIAGSDGNTYWFGDTGKIYKRTSGGTWSLLTTDTHGEIFGAAEFNGYIYWATASNLARCVISSVDWETDKNETYGTFTNGTTPHPMKVHLLKLYIGDGKDVVVSTAAGTSVLDLQPDFTIQALESAGIDLLIGARVDNRNQCGIFRWNCNDDSWNFEDYINEDGINSIILENQSNEIVISAGSKGNIYQYNGYSLNFKRQIPGTYTSTAKNTVYSMANFGNLVLIGVSNSTGDPALEGVYSYEAKTYPILNLDYVISQDKTASISVGAILVVGQDIFVAWKDSTTYGVDKLDWSNKYGSAYIETMVLNPLNGTQKLFKEFGIMSQALPASCEIAVSYKKDSDSAYTAVYGSPITLADTVRQILKDTLEGNKIQIKLAFTVSANTSPAIEGMYLGFNKFEKP